MIGPKLFAESYNNITKSALILFPWHQFMSEKNALDKFASNLNSSSITFTYTWYVLIIWKLCNKRTYHYNVSKLEVKTKSVSYINYRTH